MSCQERNAEYGIFIELIHYEFLLYGNILDSTTELEDLIKCQPATISKNAIAFIFFQLISYSLGQVIKHPF